MSGALTRDTLAALLHELRMWLVYTLAGIAAAYIGNWAHQQINAKIRADEKAAAAQVRIADQFSPPRKPAAEPIKNIPIANYVKAVPSDLAPCPKEYPSDEDAPDRICEYETSVRKCFNGVGVSLWISPPYCLKWYERQRNTR